MYQKVYQDKVGTASLDIEKAIAGTEVNCRLTYKVGSLGIDDSGSMKLLFRIVSDCGKPQFEDPKSDNFVNVSSSNKKVGINVGLRSGGLYGKVYTRPWSKGFTLNFSGDYLSEDDEVYIDFKRWRIQTFCEKTFEFKILVDPFATGKYIEIPNSPFIEIIPDKPHRLIILAPTKVKVGVPFGFLVKIEDCWGNPCTNKDGVFSILPNDEIKDLPREVKFRQGRAEIKAKIDLETTTYIKAKYRNLSAISNPVTAIKKAQYFQYWAELHGQSEETVGTNGVNDWFTFARRYAFVDIACHQGNDFQITKKFWKKLNRTTKRFNKDEEFITFPGYEWSGNTANGGDRNILYLEEDLPIFRSSHALIDQFDDLDSDANTAIELFGKLPRQKTIVFAHGGGRYSDLSIHDEKLERAVEIHSCWGTFEWLFLEALKRNYKVGVVANSDGHTGRPGASYPSFAHFNSYGGLTCILAERLTRKNIFNALYNRHCYATTGARVFLEVQCLLGKKIAGIMGDAIKIKNMPTLSVKYRGTSPLDRVEIFNKARLIYTHFPEIKNKSPKTIKAIWSGSKVKGRKRSFSWRGDLRLKNNSIKSVRKINFYSQKSFVTWDKNSVSWEGGTTGGVQGLIIELEKQTGELNLNVNQKKIGLPIETITQKPKTYNMGGLDARLEIYQTSSSNQPHNIELKYRLERFTEGVNPVFVKITQKDGHMAWTSPIYFVR